MKKKTERKNQYQNRNTLCFKFPVQAYSLSLLNAIVLLVQLVGLVGFMVEEEIRNTYHERLQTSVFNVINQIDFTLHQKGFPAVYRQKRPDFPVYS